MRASAMSLALEGTLAEHYHKHICILKARASGLHSEKHNTWPGQAVAFWDVLAIKNKQNTPIQNQDQE